MHWSMFASVLCLASNAVGLHEVRSKRQFHANHHQSFDCWDGSNSGDPQCNTTAVGTVATQTTTPFRLTSDQISAYGLDQNQLNTLAETLKIEVRVIDNLIMEKTNHVVKTTLRNEGNVPIPASGWKLYFYSMLLLYPDTFPSNIKKELEVEQIRVGMVQGDLYYIEPMSGFKPLPAGSVRDYNIVVSLWAVQRTDFMPLWYVTSDDASVEPRVVRSTSSFDLDYVSDFDDVRQWKRWRDDRYNPFTPQERAERLAYDDTNVEAKLIMPTPKSLQIDPQKPVMSFNSGWKVFAEDSIFNDTALYITEELLIQHVISKPNTNVIILSHNATTEPEGYTLNVDANVIRLEASDAAGMFYAVQSLRSLIDGARGADIPAMTVHDAPRYGWRGMLLDVARNFHTLDDVKRLIDVMAMYKMNVLHLHLTDDEGWRLEIDGLPELTEVGGKRCHDLQENDCIIPQFGSGPFTNSSGSGFFNKSQYREVLSYAKKNRIKVVPEFDMPGHCHAAVASMESRFRKTNSSAYRLLDPDDKSVYVSAQNWKDDAINPCISSTYAFIGKVMDAVKALHAYIQPLEIYHFGGDEVAPGAWEKSPRCEQLLRAHPRYNVTHGLKNYFIERVAKLAADRGLSLGGWDFGFPDSSAPLPAGDLSNPWNNILVWGGGSNAYKFANAGYKVILTQVENLYFDHPQEPDPEERGMYWATRYTDTRKVFDFRPDALYDNIREDSSGNPQSKHDVCGDDMSKCTRLEKPENVIGMQGAMWSETIRTSENVDYMIFPRLLALAERAWHKAPFEQTSASSRNDWLTFAKALGEKEFRRLEENGVQYRIPPPGARVSSFKVTVTTTYPGLGAQYSSNNGSTWKNVGVNQATTVTWNHAGSILLRAQNAAGTRYSRSVKLSRESSGSEFLPIFHPHPITTEWDGKPNITVTVPVSTVTPPQNSSFNITTPSWTTDVSVSTSTPTDSSTTTTSATPSTTTPSVTTSSATPSTTTSSVTTSSASPSTTISSVTTSSATPSTTISSVTPSSASPSTTLSRVTTSSPSSSTASSNATTHSTTLSTTASSATPTTTESTSTPKVSSPTPTTTSRTTKPTTTNAKPTVTTNVTINATTAPCEDLKDCAHFGRNICVDDPTNNVYLPFAKKNCPLYCGFCKPTTFVCRDVKPDCPSFDGGTLCTDPDYTQWVYENCMVYCHVYPCNGTVPVTSVF